jgi:DNA-binding IclR family transcriptional regulator
MKSVRNAIKTLQLFSPDTPQISVSNVSDYLRIPKSSASRMLTAMKEFGIVEQEQSRGPYRPGVLAFKLASVYSITHSSRDIIRKAMQKLAALTHHSCWVSTLSGTDLVVLESVHGGYPVRLVVETGSRLPAHLTAAGKALLARLSDAEVRQIYPGSALRTYTEHSLRTVDKLLAELAIVRDRGWAQTDQEVVGGIKSIGVSLCPLGETSSFALSVSFPLANVTKAEANAVHESLLRISEDLGRRLGDPLWSRIADRSETTPKKTTQGRKLKRAKRRR